MQFRQPFQARTDIVKLVNFVEDSLKSHGSALFIRAKWKRTSDELLSSEDLKEEKVVTTLQKSECGRKKAGLFGPGLLKHFSENQLTVMLAEA